MALQNGGCVHGHLNGTFACTNAAIQAIEAFKDGITLEEKAKQ